MNFHVLIPTDDVVQHTIEQNTVGRNDQLLFFLQMLGNINSGTIEINAEWGAGKTFFVKQAKFLLESKNSIDKDHYIVGQRLALPNMKNEIIEMMNLLSEFSSYRE